MKYALIVCTTLFTAPAFGFDAPKTAGEPHWPNASPAQLPLPSGAAQKALLNLFQNRPCCEHGVKEDCLIPCAV